MKGIRLDTDLRITNIRSIADSTIVRTTVLSEQQELELEHEELLIFFFPLNVVDGGGSTGDR